MQALPGHIEAASPTFTDLACASSDVVPDHMYADVCISVTFVTRVEWHGALGGGGKARVYGPSALKGRGACLDTHTLKSQRESKNVSKTIEKYIGYSSSAHTILLAVVIVQCVVLLCSETT